MADCIRELCVEKNAQIHFVWSILIKKAIKKVFWQNLVRQ